jgi:hypothetical protein
VQQFGKLPTFSPFEGKENKMTKFVPGKRIYKFTTLWAVTPDGERLSAPEVPAFHRAFSYEDDSCDLEGVYWAIVPEDWSQEEAWKEYREQCSDSGYVLVGIWELPPWFLG